jgi:hypothetical protein
MRWRSVGKSASVNKFGGWLDDAHWRRWFWLFWIGTIAYMLWWRWGAIHWFALSDTDDNLRMAQVRALLNGQSWFDLRQYKLDPPAGANIHWSRLVDLPIAGLIFALKPFLGGAMAEKWAAAIAPLLSLGAGLYALMLAVRRLVGRDNNLILLLAFLILIFGAQNTLYMWRPLRIDHHGWQLVMLALGVAGSADSRQVRGGITAGLATAASFIIGLELLPTLAIVGGVTALRWIWDRQEAPRLTAYALALSGGAAAGFLLFASQDNRQFVCDALSPVYLSLLLLAGALLVGMARLRTESRLARLGAAGAAGALLAVFFASAWPQCLGRPEHLSPEAQRLWFDYIREVKPIYRHGWSTMLTGGTLPLIGALGALVMLWRTRGTPGFWPWASIALPSLFSTVMLLWQTRYSASAQLLALPGATALGWMAVERVWRRRFRLADLAIAAPALLLVTGGASQLAADSIPQKPRSPSYARAASLARRCPTLPGLRPIAQLPPSTILTFVDFGPRLVTVTHHRAIAGPYHRNQQAILDVHHAFRNKDPEVAHQVMRRHGATLLLLCPGMPESTIYASQARDGFYMQLVRGRVPGWLERVALPESSPFRLWRRVE